MCDHAANDAPATPCPHRPTSLRRARTCRPRPPAAALAVRLAPPPRHAQDPPHSGQIHTFTHFISALMWGSGEKSGSTSTRAILNVPRDFSSDRDLRSVESRQVTGVHMPLLRTQAFSTTVIVKSLVFVCTHYEELHKIVGIVGTLIKAYTDR